MSRIIGNPLDPLYKHNNRSMNKWCESDGCTNYALWDIAKKRFRTYCESHTKGPRYSKDILADPSEI